MEWDFSRMARAVAVVKLVRRGGSRRHFTACRAHYGPCAAAKGLGRFAVA